MYKILYIPEGTYIPGIFYKTEKEAMEAFVYYFYVSYNNNDKICLKEFPWLFEIVEVPGG